MGLIITDPVFGDDCALCFPAGKTPKYMMVSFAGIVTTKWWQSGFFPPPNRTFRYEQTVSCNWFYAAGDGYGYLNITANKTVLAFAPHPMVAFAFGSVVAVECCWIHYNQLSEAAGDWYEGGQAQIAWV